MVKFGNSQRVVGYESGFDQYGNALQSWQDAGKIFEQNRQRKRKEGMENEEWPLLIERLALDNAKLKDALAAAPDERALRARSTDATIRGIDAGIEDRDEDRALRAKALAGDDEDRALRRADDDRARAAWAKIAARMGGGQGQPAAGGAAPAAPAGGGLPAIDGVPPMLRRPAENDANFNGIPDDLEMQDYDSETDSLMGELAPLMGDLPPEQSSRLMASLTSQRGQGRSKVRASQVASSVVKLVNAGALDQGMAQRALSMLDAGMDPDDVYKQIDNLMAATEKEAADVDVKTTAQAISDEVLANIQAIGHRLSPGATAEIAALRQRIVNPLTTGKQAMEWSQEIRRIAFKDAADGGEKPWYEQDSIAAILKSDLPGQYERAVDMARKLGLKGAPRSQPATQGAGAQADPDPALVEGLADIRFKLKNELGREPSKYEVLAAAGLSGPPPPGGPGAPMSEEGRADMRARGVDYDSLMRKAGGGQSPAAQPSGSEPRGSDEKRSVLLRRNAGSYISRSEQRAIDDAEREEKRVASEGRMAENRKASERAFLMSALGSVPDSESARKDALDRLDDMIEDARGGYKTKLAKARDHLRSMPIREQVVRFDEPELTEEEARKRFAADPRLRMKRGPRGGYVIVAQNDVLKNTDPKLGHRNQ